MEAMIVLMIAPYMPISGRGTKIRFNVTFTIAPMKPFFSAYRKCRSLHSLQQPCDRKNDVVWR